MKFANLNESFARLYGLDVKVDSINEDVDDIDEIKDEEEIVSEVEPEADGEVDEVSPDAECVTRLFNEYLDYLKAEEGSEDEEESEEEPEEETEEESEEEFEEKISFEDWLRESGYIIAEAINEGIFDYLGERGNRFASKMRNKAANKAGMRGREMDYAYNRRSQVAHGKKADLNRAERNSTSFADAMRARDRIEKRDATRRSDADDAYKAKIKPIIELAAKRFADCTDLNDLALEKDSLIDELMRRNRHFSYDDPLVYEIEKEYRKAKKAL